MSFSLTVRSGTDPRLAAGPVKGLHRIPVIRPTRTARDEIDRQRLQSKIGQGHAGLDCAVGASAGAEAGVPLWTSGPLRSRAPPMTAPAAKMPAIHQNAVS